MRRDLAIFWSGSCLGSFAAALYFRGEDPWYVVTAGLFWGVAALLGWGLVWLSRRLVVGWRTRLGEQE